MVYEGLNLHGIVDLVKQKFLKKSIFEKVIQFTKNNSTEKVVLVIFSKLNNYLKYRYFQKILVFLDQQYHEECIL